MEAESGKMAMLFLKALTEWDEDQIRDVFCISELWLITKHHLDYITESVSQRFYLHVKGNYLALASDI